MPLQNFSVDIASDEGFTKNDIFNHGDLGRKLASLLMNVDHPISIAVNAQWGQGKTTFLKMWAGYLRSENFPVIEFDAFANDYYMDPFIPLAGEVINLSKLHKVFRTGIMQKATKVGLALAKGGAKIGAKAITLGLLDGKAADEITSDIADSISEYTEKQIEDTILSYEKSKNEIEEFKKSLSSLPDAITKSKKNGKESKPLIFIIDELDRCRPDYALKLIERVKHLYSVPNVHFVFGVHIKQLENCVRASYGDKIDATLYLEKFFTIKFDLSDRNGKINQSNRAIYLSRINSLKNTRINITSLDAFFEKKKASLRQIEKIMQEYIVIYSKERSESLNAYLLLLLCIKNFEYDIFDRIVNSKLTAEEAVAILEEYESGTN